MHAWLASTSASSASLYTACLRAHTHSLRWLTLATSHPATITALPPIFADLARVKDEKHLQRPQRGQWAVMLEPLPPEKPTKKKDKPEAAAAAAAAVPVDGAAEQEAAPQAAVQEQQAGAAAQ